MLRKLLLLVLFVIFFASQAMAQTGSITGTVTNEDGEPIPTANVLLVEISRGAATNLQGKYTIEDVQAGTYTLRVTFVGYQDFLEQVTIEADQVLERDVTLSAKAVGLKELVVVGYGQQIKKELTGSIAQVSAEEIATTPVNTLGGALQGRVAGVQITGKSGKINQPISINIRGRASISGGTDPLYVIDGMPVYTENLNPLMSLSLNNIKSISILKDASAAAIYGSRASNGVVIITTKSGRGGETRYNVNYQVGFSEPSNLRPFLNGQQYINLFTEAAINGAAYAYKRGGNPAGYPSLQAAKDDYLETIRSFFTYRSQGRDWRTNPFNTNWQKKAFQDGLNQRFNISAGGGNEDTQFFAVAGYNQVRGILIGNDLTKFTGRINLDHTASETLHLGVNLSIGRTIIAGVPVDGSFSTPMQLVAAPPIAPMFLDADSDFSNGYQKGDEYFERPLYINGVFANKYTIDKEKTFHILGMTSATYNFMPNLEWTNEFGMDLIIEHAKDYENPILSNDNTPGEAFSGWTQVQNYNINSFLTYDLTINADHELEVTGGSSYNWVTYHTTNVSGGSFPNANFKNLANAAVISGAYGAENNYSFLSFFARGNYDYLDKYIATLSIRADGSSRFGKKHRFGFFPAVSAGWILTEEDFLDDSDIFSFLKLRASYGVTGNADIGNFPALGLYEGVSYVGNTGLRPEQTANPDLKWETTTQYDIGIDFGLFNGRVSGKLDYYHKKTTDLLLFVNLPGQTGYTSQLQNVGSLKNYGFEVSINTINTTGALFWTTTLNLSFNRNRLVDLNNQIIEGAYISWALEGYPIGMFYTYEYAGVDPDNGDALYWINTENPKTGLGIIDHSLGKTTNPNLANRVPVANPHPDFIGGIKNRLSWKGFTLDMLWQFSYGAKIYNGAGRFMTASASYYDNQTIDQLRAWEEPGDITDVPEARLFWGNGTIASSRWIYDGSYLRLKALTFSYNLPNEFLNRLNMRRARLYITGTNLLTFTKYPGWDPELNTDYDAGILAIQTDFYTAPQPRTISLGIELGF